MIRSLMLQVNKFQSSGFFRKIIMSTSKAITWYNYNKKIFIFRRWGRRQRQPRSLRRPGLQRTQPRTLRRLRLRFQPLGKRSIVAPNALPSSPPLPRKMTRWIVLLTQTQLLHSFLEIILILHFVNVPQLSFENKFSFSEKNIQI